MITLGIETSCDETGAAFVRDGKEVLANVVSSQVKLHAPYGGVVPEIASRSHVEHLPAVVSRAFSDAGLDWSHVDCVAATSGPGLASSLLTGLSFAKGVSMRLELPLYGVNHIRAHVYSVFLEKDAPDMRGVCPFVSLIVSGGHTSLIRFSEPGSYELLGETIDDAAGEAFDKGAKLLHLGYPGGPAIDRVAKRGDAAFIDFPRSRPRKIDSRGRLDPELCFSFSGLKTSLLYYLKQHPVGDEERLTSIAASYQEAIVDSLVERCRRAMRGERNLVVAGGVSLNSRLRSKLAGMCADLNVNLLMPKASYCTDNAAMIAAASELDESLTPSDPAVLDANPNRSFDD